MSVLLETSYGTLVLDLYVKERPKSCMNFLKLCKLYYYNGCIFHTVQKNLVAQTGDPSGTGRGGESVFEQLYGDQAKYFDRELKPIIHHRRRGLLSMVDNGYGQHGSQFFVTLSDNLDYLNGKHTVFGIVAEGEDILDKLNETYCDKESRPFRNIRIHHTIILDDPFPDPRCLHVPVKSPDFIRKLQLGSEAIAPRIEEDEELDDTVGLTEEQLADFRANQEELANARLLTLIGDLPDANARPPDNVLFVCRLNPVTTGEDLEIIFSRFGEITSCEVIRDKRTDASLQYAFIEYSTKEECEAAFFKMDNVVIDDRRIHVDFSQSVATQWREYKGSKMQPHPPPVSRRLPHPTMGQGRPALRPTEDSRRHKRDLPIERERRLPRKYSQSYRSASPSSSTGRHDSDSNGMDYLLSDSDDSLAARRVSKQKSSRKRKSSTCHSQERKTPKNDTHR